MSRDMLSQEEIDALLQQNNDDQEGEQIDLDQLLSPFDQDALGEIGNISFGSASTALSTLLRRKVEITTPNVTAIKKEDIVKYFPRPHVSILVKYLEGFQGSNLLVIKSEAAKIIADLMLGGNGQEISNFELSDMDISAVQEAMNQMMGSSATSMSTIFDTKINISPPEVNILDLNSGAGENTIPDDDILIMVSFNLLIGDLVDSNIMQLISVPFAKEMINRLIGTTDSEASDPRTDAVQEQMVASSSELLPDNLIQSEQSTFNNYQAPNNIKRNTLPNHNVNAQSAQFVDFAHDSVAKNEDPNLGLLMDIPLQITVELGRTKKLIRDILELSQGSIVELDKLAGEPVDIFANNKLIAKGEVVVIDENFGVRVTDILSQYERVRKLQ